MANKERRFVGWNRELEQIVRERMGVPLEDVADHDPEIARSFFNDGTAPIDYFREHLMPTSGGMSDEPLELGN